MPRVQDLVERRPSVSRAVKIKPILGERRPALGNVCSGDTGVNAAVSLAALDSVVHIHRQDGRPDDVFMRGGAGSVGPLAVTRVVGRPDAHVVTGVVGQAVDFGVGLSSVIRDVHPAGGGVVVVSCLIGGDAGLVLHRVGGDVRVALGRIPAHDEPGVARGDGQVDGSAGRGVCRRR